MRNSTWPASSTEGLFYRRASGELVKTIKNRFVLSTPQGGKVVIDSALRSLLERADGRTLTELVQDSSIAGVSPEAVRAALACLAEAGLLSRSRDTEKPETIPPVKGKLVSAVIVNYHSLDWLKECLASLAAQVYSPLEVIVVNNGAQAEASAWLQEVDPEIQVITLEPAAGLATALNAGVRAARGDYFFLLNPDVTIEPDALARLVQVAESDPTCAAVAGKLKFYWAPGFLNGLGNRVGPMSYGVDNGLGHLDLGQFDDWREVPSACFAAALVSRTAWERVGPLDEQLPMYYEDSEWSYRARLSGYTIRAAPEAVIYHAFGARVHTGEEEDLSARKLRSVTYGRLRFALKLVPFPLLLRFLFTYSLEDALRFGMALVRLKFGNAAAIFRGRMSIWSDRAEILQARRQVQAGRKLSGSQLFAHQAGLPAPFIWRGLPELTWDLVQSAYLPLFLSGRTRPMPEFEEKREQPRLLIISNDVIDTKMAGPGMRYLEIGRALGDGLQVTLAHPGKTDLQFPEMRLASYSDQDPAALKGLLESCDVILASPFILNKFPFLLQSTPRLVVDLYDPFLFENLHYYLNEPGELQSELNRQAVDLVNRSARAGDFFICGSQRQRDLWIGVLTANGRVNPANFSHDPSLKSLIEVVGVGFPGRQPNHSPVLIGVHPAFPEGTRIVLWGGGVWDWLDPLTLVRAWPQVFKQHPEARLVFLGTRHPNPLVPRHVKAGQAEKLAEELGEKDKSVFFFDWLPYEQREALLCESSVGVTLHPEHVETRFAIRTRMFDYFWTGLPVLVSDGDVTSEWVRQYSLGRVVPPCDEKAAAAALVDLLDRPKSEWAAFFEPLREVFEWSRVVEPLRRYCLQGEAAPDRAAARQPAAQPGKSSAWKSRLARARYIFRTEGPAVLLHRSWRFIQWRLSQL